MKRNALKYYLFALAVIIGFITTVQFKSDAVYQGIVTIPKLLELQEEIKSSDAENKLINESIREQAQILADYEAGVDSTGNAFGIMQNELEKIRNYSDYEKVQGPGIIITLNDSQQEVAEGEDVAWYLVHDIDILEIVNELRIAGAEAIAINEERVTATTSIRCGGPTINIDGKRHAVPFVIKAIGDPKALEASALAPDSYIGLYMSFSGIQIEIQKVEKLIIKGYEGRNKLRYQRKTEGGEAK
jgi:uncharacterized protein YlxW (UPF0749 family)